MNTQRLIHSVIALVTVAAVSGCAVVPAPDYYQPNVVYSDDLPPPVYANLPPPTSQVEVVGVAPAPGYFWISGFWLWQGGRHVWRPGHWSAPRPGYDWNPNRWQQDGRSWRMDGGHWVRRMNTLPMNQRPVMPRPGRY